MRKSERFAETVRVLVSRPGHVFSLGYFADRFGVSKSTVSEDLRTLRELFDRRQMGTVQTIPGAQGGVRYVPHIADADVEATVDELCEQLRDPARILPGGFLYMSDLIASPDLTERMGRIFASMFRDREPDTVMTLETRGIPVALMTARALNVPLAIARRVNRVTEGTAVTVNYVSGSRRVETMCLSRRALAPGARVLIIDDFMKAGSTAKGLMDLAAEFQAMVVGIGVLVETEVPQGKMVDGYVSLAVLQHVDETHPSVVIRSSDWVKVPPQNPAKHV